MKTLKLTGVKKLQEDVVITISAGEPSDEMHEKEGKALAQVLVDSLPFGVVLYTAEKLYDEILKLREMADLLGLLEASASVLGIKLPEYKE